MESQNVFERIKHLNSIGQEYWSGRELFKILQYIKWDKFLNVIDKAKEACKNSGQCPNDHFSRVEKMVGIGSNAKRDIGDLRIALKKLIPEKTLTNSQIPPFLSIH